MPAAPEALKDYVSYLLWLWQVGNTEKPEWRAALKRTDTGEQVDIANMEALLEQLWCKQV
jgi:hypothetical protein